MWKSLVKVFNILVNWTTWKIGQANKLRLGANTWIGCNGNFRLLEPLLETRHAKEITRLSDVSGNVI